MKRHTHRLLDALAAAESEFFAGEFLAPRVRGGRVGVRLAGVACRFEVRPAGFEGFGVFRPVGPTAAELVRPAGLAGRARYLERLAPVRLILTGRRGRAWTGLPARPAGGAVPTDAPLPVYLAEEVRPFDAVDARFDGRQCWFEGPAVDHDPAASAYLRDALWRRVEPDRLNRPGLLVAERTAYADALAAIRRSERAATETRDERRLRTALAHAGAELADFVERPDGYQVAFAVDGRRHVAAVARDDLTVLSAGFCLSGEDTLFDLQSLVGVVREGRAAGERIEADEEL